MDITAVQCHVSSTVVQKSGQLCTQQEKCQRSAESRSGSATMRWRPVLVCHAKASAQYTTYYMVYMYTADVHMSCNGTYAMQ
eukprot:13899-Heterococcus_DN1.PRE.3